MVIYSLKNDIMPSFHSSHTDPKLPKLCQFCQCNHVRVHPYAYAQHMMVLEHFLCIQYGCGMQSVVVYSLNNVVMPSFHSSHAGSNYLNLGQLCQCNSVRVHPYTYPQHMIRGSGPSFLSFVCFGGKHFPFPDGLTASCLTKNRTEEQQTASNFSTPWILPPPS